MQSILSSPTSQRRISIEAESLPDEALPPLAPHTGSFFGIDSSLTVFTRLFIRPTMYSVPSPILIFPQPRKCEHRQRLVANTYFQTGVLSQNDFPNRRDAGNYFSPHFSPKSSGLSWKCGISQRVPSTYAHLSRWFRHPTGVSGCDVWDLSNAETVHWEEKFADCRCHSDTIYDSPGTHRKRDCRYVLDPAGIQKHLPLSTKCCQERESRPSCLMCYRGIPVGVNPGRYLHLFLGPLPHILLCLEVVRADTLNQRKKMKKCVVKRVRCTR